MLTEQRGGAGLLDHQQPGDLSTLEHAHQTFKNIKNLGLSESQTLLNHEE
jgi:hypothetical protein